MRLRTSLILLSLISSVLLYGCSSLRPSTEYPESARVDIEKPAEAVQKRSVEVKERSKEIREYSRDIDLTADSPEISAKARKITSRADLNIEGAGEIYMTAVALQDYQESINDLYGKLDRLSSEKKDLISEKESLVEEIENQKQDITRRENRILMTLSIFGLVIATVGGVLGYRFVGRGVGVSLFLVGASLAGAARVWRDHGWIVSAVGAVFLVGVLGYLAYQLFIQRKAFFKELTGQTKTGKEEKVVQDIRKKGH